MQGTTYDLSYQMLSTCANNSKTITQHKNVAFKWSVALIQINCESRSNLLDWKQTKPRQ